MKDILWMFVARIDWSLILLVVVRFVWKACHIAFLDFKMSRELPTQLAFLTTSWQCIPFSPNIFTITFCLKLSYPSWDAYDKDAFNGKTVPYDKISPPTRTWTPNYTSKWFWSASSFLLKECWGEVKEQQCIPF